MAKRKMQWFIFWWTHTVQTLSS